MKKAQVIYPLPDKRLDNKQSPFFLTRKQFSLFFIHVAIYSSTIFSFPDESEEEGAAQPHSKEEEKVEVMRTWMEARGFSNPTRGRSLGAFVRGRFVLLSPILPSFFYFPIDIKFSFITLVFYLVSFRG